MLQIPCQEVFGPPKGLLRKCLGVQTPTHKVFERLGSSWWLSFKPFEKNMRLLVILVNAYFPQAKKRGENNEERIAESHQPTRGLIAVSSLPKLMPATRGAQKPIKQPLKCSGSSKYTWYIYIYIYVLYIPPDDYMLPTTFYKNLKKSIDKNIGFITYK